MVHLKCACAKIKLTRVGALENGALEIRMRKDKTYPGWPPRFVFTLSVAKFSLGSIWGKLTFRVGLIQPLSNSERNGTLEVTRMTPGNRYTHTLYINNGLIYSKREARNILFFHWEFCKNV